jgi:superfamily II helicase
MGYCNGDCEYLERDKKHTCARYGLHGTRLAYMSQSGSISYTAHERCDLCSKDRWINELEKRIKNATKDLTELLNNANDNSDYREGIITVLDNLDWYRKI